jgi:pimeloyl-ACP methyl ester carboxylesterase
MINRIFNITTILVIAIIIATKNASASSIYFEDNFDSLNETTWEVFGDSSSVNVNSGILEIKPPSNIYTNYIRSRNNFFPEEGDFIVEYRFQYPQLTFAGTGIVLGESNPFYPVAVNDPVSSRILTTWQDLGTPLVGLFGPSRFSLLTSTSTNYHTYRVEFVENSYKVFLDNELKFTSDESQRRIKSIWIGNPGPADSARSWTQLNLDYIKVSRFDNVPALSVSSIYDLSNKQVPRDRDLSIKVNVKNGTNQVVEGAEVKARVLSSNDGTFATESATTINNGDAYFVFKPNNNSLGQTTLEFSYGEAKSQYAINLYRPPIVIVPGMGASFNLNKFFYDDSNQTDWNWSPTARWGWDEFLAEIEGDGYQENIDYSVAFYDWRKSLDKYDYEGGEVEATGKNLKPKIDKMLEGKPDGQKVNIIAHSFGGLLTRSLIQNDFDDNKINKFVTIGTPHTGATAGYYLWNGAQVPPTGDAWFRLLTGNILKVYTHKSLFTDVSAVRENFKSFRQLLPIYQDYVTRNNQILGTNDLTFTNNILNYDVTIDDFVVDVANKNIDFVSIYGKGQDTLKNITVGAVDPESVLWPDGKPEKNPKLVDGDDSVLQESAQVPNFTSVEISGKHGDLPDLAMSKILKLFRITHIDPPVQPPVGFRTPNRILGTTVMSPANAEIINENGQILVTTTEWPDADVSFGYLSDPADGIYTIKVKGTGTGNYLLYVPYAGVNVWKELEFSGTTSLDKIDTYKIFVSNNGLNDAISKLVETTMGWQIGTINFKKRLVPIDYIIKLPDNFDTNQLKLTEVRFNDKYLKVLSSKVDKKNKKLTVTLDGRDVAKAINWRESEEKIKMLVSGENQSLLSTLRVRIPWGLYKKYMQ